MISIRFLSRITSSFLVLISCSLFLTACQSPKTSYASVVNVKENSKRPNKDSLRYQGSYKIGKPYKIKRIKYYPKNYTKYVSKGIASWYGEIDGFHGKPTANGDIFDKNMLTAAHKTLPLPCMIKVTNLENNKALILMVNDRGPFSSKRLLDVSEQGAEILGFRNKGTAKVKIEYLPRETDKLLAKLQLRKVEGTYAEQNIKNPKCSVDCYLKTVNIINKLHSSTMFASLRNNFDDEKDLTRTLTAKKPITSNISLVSSTYTETSPLNSSKNSKITAPKKVNLSSSIHNYYIVIGKFNSVSQTRKLLTTIKKLGPSRISNENKGFYIKLGPINNFFKAKKIASKIANMAGTTTKIVKTSPKTL